jgi:hypothetical protein
LVLGLPTFVLDTGLTSFASKTQARTGGIRIQLLE